MTKDVQDKQWQIDAIAGYYDTGPPVVDPTGDEPFYAFPETTVWYMTTDNTIAIKNGGVPTPLTIAMQRTPIALMQGGDMFTASQRAGAVPFWTQFHAGAVPGQHLVNHRYAKSVKGTYPVGDSKQGMIAWRAIFEQKIANALLTRGNGNWIGGENNPTGWLFNFAPEPQGGGKFFADEHIVIHDQLVANIGPYLQIYYDGFPNLNTDRYSQQLFGGNSSPNSISSIPTVGVVRIPYWSGFTQVGTPDGDGFYSDWTQWDGVNPTLLWRRDSEPMTGGGKVTGIKHNGTSSTDIRWNTYNNPSAPVAGDVFGVMNGDRDGYAADFDGDGQDENRTDPVGARVRENAKIGMMQYQSDAMFARWGYRGWVCCNGLSTSSELKYRSVNPWLADDESYDRYDWVSGESYNNSKRFDAFDGTGFNVKLTSIEKIMHGLYYGKQWLQLDQIDPNTGLARNERCPYPFVLPAFEAGVPARVTGSNDWTSWLYYSNPSNPESRLLAAFLRFWRGVTLSVSHFFMSASGESNGSEPWWSEDMFYSLGWPENDLTREIGTFDRTVAGPAAFTFRAPDFGTLGFVTTFIDPVTRERTGAIAFNAETPTLANGGAVENGVNHYWTPGFGTTGPTVDLDEWAPSGKQAYNFDSATYVAKSKSTSDPRYNYIPGQDIYCAKDPIWNDGQLTGVQQLGPWEARMVRYL